MTGPTLVALMLATVSALYGGAVVGYCWADRPGLAVAFFGYIIANGGLIWDALR